MKLPQIARCASSIPDLYDRTMSSPQLPRQDRVLGDADTASSSGGRTAGAWRGSERTAGLTSCRCCTA